MTENDAFARLVSLACHDLRTPLATAFGFARTLTRARLEEPAARYSEMVAAATAELGELIDALAVAARIEARTYDPVLDEVDAASLARSAVERVEEGRAAATGRGTTVRVDREPLERGLAALARCALRHGGVDRVQLAVEGPEVRLSPVVAEARRVIVAEDLRDLGAAVAGMVVRALGGSLALEDETLVVRLPSG